MLNGTNRRHDTWRCVLHTWGKCWNTHRDTRTHPSETADSQGFAFCSAYMEVIDIWLLPFNRIPLVLGFLCSVEDAHAISPAWVGEREIGVIECGRSGEWKVGLWLQWQRCTDKGVALMTLPVKQALISQAIFSSVERWHCHGLIDWWSISLEERTPVSLSHRSSNLTDAVPSDPQY